MPKLNFSLSDDAEYERLLTQRTELLKRQAEHERYVNRLLNSGEQGERSRSERETQLNAVLEGKEPFFEQTRPISHEYDKALAKRRLLREAVELLDKQLEQARYRVSAEICKGVSAEYSSDCRKFFLSLVEMAKSSAVIDEWREEFKTASVSYAAYMNVVDACPLGNAFDRYSRLAILLIEAHRQDFIKTSDVPQAWRESWYKLHGFKFADDRLSVQPVKCEAELYAEYISKKNNPMSQILAKSKQKNSKEVLDNEKKF